MRKIFEKIIDILSWMPKCEKGGRCNMDNRFFYCKRISWYGIINGYKYYCTKCGKETTKYGEI